MPPEVDDETEHLADLWSGGTLPSSGVAGSVYDLAASPSLADLLKDVSAQVPDPDRTGKSLADPKRTADDENLKVLEVAPLGSGSGEWNVPITDEFGVVRKRLARGRNTLTLAPSILVIGDDVCA